MPFVARIVVDQDIPHCGDVLLRLPQGTPPVPVNVCAGGVPVSRFGDPNNPHLPQVCYGAHVGHVRPVNNVFVWGVPIARADDPVDCGTIVMSGLATVIAGP